MDKENAEDGLDDVLEEAARTGAVVENVARHTQVMDLQRDLQEHIEQIVQQYKNAHIATKAGFVAEEYHAVTFNQDAVLKGRRDLFAHRIILNGIDPKKTNTNVKVDIELLKNGQEPLQVQVKYTGTTAQTAYNLAHPDYDGMVKLHPSDQDVKRISQLRLDTLQNSTRQHSEYPVPTNRNYLDNVENATDRLKYENVEGKPLSRADALSLADDVATLTKKALQTEALNAVKGGAIIGGVYSGGVSFISNTAKVVRGEREVPEAMLDVAKDTAVGSLDGAVKGVASVAVKAALFRVGAVTVARSSAPIAVAVTVIDIGKDITQAVTGKIDGKELSSRAVQKAATGAGAWGGMELGAAVGTAVFPGVGTIVGGVVGGIAGHLGTTAATNFFKKKIQERKKAKLLQQNEDKPESGPGAPNPQPV